MTYTLGRPEVRGRLFKPTFLTLFGVGEDWRIFMRACDKIADNFKRNCFACVNTSTKLPIISVTS